MTNRNWLHDQLVEAEQNVSKWPRWKLREAGIDHLFPETEMNWTTTTPAKYGYYWWKIDPQVEAEIVLVFGDGTFCRSGDDTIFDCEFEGGEWFGPLESPK